MRFQWRFRNWSDGKHLHDWTFGWICELYTCVYVRVMCAKPFLFLVVKITLGKNLFWSKNEPHWDNLNVYVCFLCYIVCLFGVPLSSRFLIPVKNDYKKAPICFLCSWFYCFLRCALWRPFRKGIFLLCAHFATPGYQKRLKHPKWKTHKTKIYLCRTTEYIIYMPVYNYKWAQISWHET